MPNPEIVCRPYGAAYSYQHAALLVILSLAWFIITYLRRQQREAQEQPITARA
jgi:hypothetical protein